MPVTQPTSAQTRITELHRTGAGGFAVGETEFVWDGGTHSSILGNLKFKLQAKVPRHDMPGGERVVHHAMTATWQPFEFGGEWKDKWLGQGQAWQMFLEFAAFVGKMPLVRMTIDALSWVGIITDLEIDYRTTDDISWTCMLSPEENESVGSFRKLASQVLFSKSIPQWLNEAGAQTEALQVLLDSSSNIPLSTEDFLDQNAAMVDLTDAFDRANSIGKSGLASDTQRQLLLLAMSFRKIHSAALRMFALVSRKRADKAVAFDDFLEILDYESWVHGNVSSTWTTIGLCREAEQDMRSRASTRPRAIHHAKPGESLERISVKYYGTPDNSRLIYTTNGLHSLVLDGSEELIIPEVGA